MLHGTQAARTDGTGGAAPLSGTAGVAMAAPGLLNDSFVVSRGVCGGPSGVVLGADAFEKVRWSAEMSAAGVGTMATSPPAPSMACCTSLSEGVGKECGGGAGRW